MISQSKAPDQIRRETVPAKHYGLLYGFLGGMVGVTIWFGGWALFHQDQVMNYPEYVMCSLKGSARHLTLFGARQKTRAGMDADQLNFALMRYGNKDHRLDAELIRHGRYPKGESPAPWVWNNGAIAPLYSEPPLLVFKWPFVLSTLTFLAALIWGFTKEFKYRSSIIAGVPFDGSILGTVSDYNRKTKGDGMKYRVMSRKDR